MDTGEGGPYVTDNVKCLDGKAGSWVEEQKGGWVMDGWEGRRQSLQ